LSPFFNFISLICTQLYPFAKIRMRISKIPLSNQIWVFTWKKKQYTNIMFGGL
jgi:hypothetical protein